MKKIVLFHKSTYKFLKKLQVVIVFLILINDCYILTKSFTCFLHLFLCIFFQKKSLYYLVRFKSAYFDTVLSFKFSLEFRLINAIPFFHFFSVVFVGFCRIFFYSNSNILNQIRLNMDSPVDLLFVVIFFSSFSCCGARIIRR